MKRHDHSMVECGNGTVVLFGGYTSRGVGDEEVEHALNDLWVLDQSKCVGKWRWKELAAIGDVPLARANASLVAVPPLGGLLCFGGYSVRSSRFSLDLSLFEL